MSLAGAPAGVELPDAAELVASLEGVHVLHVPLEAPVSGRVRSADVSAAAQVIARQIGDDLLLVVTNASGSQLHFVLPDLTDARPTLRRIVVERDLPRRTAVQQIATIYWQHQATGRVRDALDAAFDVEPVTRRFFAEYKRMFEHVERSVTGFTEDDAEERRLFVQTLFNRLMFVYFLSRKGWLTFKRDNDYLNALFRDYQAVESQDKNFYFNRLRLLFFAGLNNYRSEDLTAEPEAQRLIGNVPFLNGSLFDMTDEDGRTNIVVPDECITEVFENLFDRFNFTVMESTPFDIEVAVDPEMLGKVFEELVTGRNESGSYYTPRPVVSFMCREGLKGYLGARDTGLSAEVIAAFVDEHRTDGIDVAAARRVAGALAEVTVVDPACGSGAYLLGMMQELVELQTVLFNAGADAKSLHDLKLEIIQRNLYGADIDEFAVNIAMLRMWLSLAIEYEGEPPIPPLPNLDMKVLEGDSLLAPDPSAGVVARDTASAQMTLGRDPARLAKLDALKAEYLRAREPGRKQELRDLIAGIEDELREALGDASVVPPKSVDWRIAFAEVFAGGGFDIAVANPPYIQLQKEGGKLANAYKACGYETFARTGDIYQLFYERGCQLLKADGGLLAYITSNSWLRAEYGKLTRRYFTESHAPLRWLDLGKDVFASAIVDSGVLLLRTGRQQQRPFPAVDMDRLPPGTPIPPAKALWGEARPNGDMPWSVLSKAEWAVMNKMHSTGTPLKDWDIAINYGVKTGLNEAFIIDNETKNALVAEDPRSAEITKPVLRGKDIRRYQAEWAGMWLIDSHNGYDDVPPIEIDGYPAIKTFLDRHYEKLAKRHDRGRTPYNLRNCAYHAEFSRPKLLWMDMSPEARFSYSDTEMFCNNKGFLLTGTSLRFLCAILNSSVVTWFVKRTARTTGMGLVQWEKFAVERIPVPRVSQAEQEPLVELVDNILAAKAADADADTEGRERELDRLVYELYGLIPEEVSAVEESLA
ncbi:MAG: class I SAM-dependent DNA methyltransferase [Dehalococcoidia bacterium]|nr:class I SAM-dependent DNA methyltransferase [Dehalococcoidia bacterium]